MGGEEKGKNGNGPWVKWAVGTIVTVLGMGTTYLATTAGVPKLKEQVRTLELREAGNTQWRTTVNEDLKEIKGDIKTILRAVRNGRSSRSQ